MPKDNPNKRGLYRKTGTHMGVEYDLTAKTPEGLMRKVIEKELAIESGNIVMNKNTTVARWCDEWLEVYKKPNIQAKHFKSLETICRLHIIPEIGGLTLIEVKKVNLQRLLNAHENESFSQVTKIRTTLYNIFNTALESDLIIKNPAQSLQLPKYNKGESIAFTEKEYNACFEVAKNHPAGLWVIMMLTCGLRPQETIPLMWSDIDFKNRTISINKAVDMFKNQPVLKETKTRAGNRHVPIYDELLDLFKNATKNSIYVFTKETGGLMTAIKIRNIWKSFIRALDIHLGAKLYRNEIVESKLQKGITPYSCRHTCITRLVLDGVDVKTVQVFAGHETAETTLKYYTHLEKHSAAKRLLYFKQSGTDSGTKYKSVDK